MTGLRFRNVDADPADPVEDWPYEALVTAIERGTVSDWRRIVEAMDARPWGPVARDVEAYAHYGEAREAIALLTEALRRARRRVKDEERAEVAAHVRRAIADSGLTAAQFAEECGTSAARLSTYAGGKVVPSAALMVRFGRVARSRSGSSGIPEGDPPTSVR